MIVIFRKTGERRYAIEIRRDGLPDLEMDPAPGFDPLVPHDLLHLVVEAVLQLDNAVFGTIAAGGDAGTFRIASDTSGSAKDLSRQRRRQKKREQALGRNKTDHYERSERAAYAGWQEWLRRTGTGAQTRKARSMSDQAGSIRDIMAADERRSLDNAMDEICTHIDRLSETWSGLAVGEDMSVSWPDLGIVTEER